MERMGALRWGFGVMRDHADAQHFAPIEGVRSRIVETATGLRMHVLEAGEPWAGAPTVLLLHGFPELAFSWRKVMPRLAAAGYRVIAPDQRGYGRTIGWTEGYDVDLAEFGMVQLVRDQVALLEALDTPHVAAVVGHDFGSPVAAWCGMIRPDIFRSVVCMSAPFAGPPGRTPASGSVGGGGGADMDAALAALDPPRKHYQRYYGERRANDDMMGAPAGLAAFLRAYFHCKSGDWAGNRPRPLDGWTAETLAELPRYYVMDQDRDMAETAAAMAPSAAEADACRWMTRDDLDVYAAEYGRTGFQGGLNWYRGAQSPKNAAELRLYAGAKLSVPSCFIGGARDWGVFQVPGALEAMETAACARYEGTVLVEGAGHWVQQEAPAATASTLVSFLETVAVD